MSIHQNLHSIRKQLPSHVTLIAVSKTQSDEAIMQAYDAGQRIFGENRIQEMEQKYHRLPKDIEWHMIGHVQTNKVKYMASFVSMVHGVDSFRLLEEINRQAFKENRIIDCLLQVHIADEESKFGFDEAEVKQVLSSHEFGGLHNIRIRGLMGMATFTDNTRQIKKEFCSLKRLLDDISAEHKSMDLLSMGMSGDYTTAIECGSTMVRIGSSIFGYR